MKAFDWFEDEEYERRRVQVEILQSQEADADNNKDKNDSCQSTIRTAPSSTLQLLDTDAYIWANPTSELELDQEWSFENFCQEHLDWYLTNTVAPCKLELDQHLDDP